MNITDKLLPEFDEEFALTRKFLDLVPDDKLSYKPHPKSMALGQLAWHIANFPDWCRHTFEKDTLQMTEEDGAKSADEWKDKKRAHMLARFDRDLSQARSDLQQATQDSFEQHWKMEWAGQTIVDSPRFDVLRKWVLSHLIHHRAQLGVYLRLNNIPIPGSYGPSADEMPG